MSDGEDSWQDIGQYCEVDLIEANISCVVDDEGTSFPQYFSLGTFKHRLLLASNDLDDATRHGYDIASDLVRRKRNFLMQLHKKQAAIAKHKLTSVFIDLEKQIDTAREDYCIQVPKYIPFFMKHIKHEPDEVFFGKYNWYYTGGCLKHLCINERQYLAYVGGKSKDNLCVAPLKCDSLWCIDKSNVVNVISPEKEIFQVVAIEKPTHNFIGIRQKQKCLVYYFNENKTIIECLNVVSDIPFASFDISSVHEELCTINVKQGLSYWDIHKNDEPMCTFFPSDNPRYDKWHNLWYSADPSVVALATRKSIKWMDRRSSNLKNSVKVGSLKGVLPDEDVSVHFASERSPYLMYVGTNVNLLMLDIRFPTSAVHRWPHGLTAPPLYSSVIPFSEDNEIACIGNHYPGNIVLLFSSKSDIYPPVEITTRMETLLSQQTSGMCLDPSIMPRMRCGLMGLTTVRSNNSSNVELLTQTTASDIFSQALFDRPLYSCDFSDLVTRTETLNASARWDLTELYTMLSNKDLKLNPPPKKSVKQEWQVSKQELLEYKDVLASIILEEWDIDKIQCQNQALSSDQKVNAWLGTYNFDSLSTSFTERDSLEDM